MDPLTLLAGGSALSGIIGSIFGGNAQKKAAKQAAQASLTATRETLALQREMFDEINTQTKPLRDMQQMAIEGRFNEQTGTWEIDPIMDAYVRGDFNPRNFDYQNEPGYQFGLDEGLKTLDRGAAARGNMLSGAQMKAGVRYGNDYATTKYQDAYNRNALERQTDFAQRNALITGGQAGVNLATGAAQNMANAGGNALMQNGQNQANAAYQRGNATANMYANVADQVSGFASNMLFLGAGG